MLRPMLSSLYTSWQIHTTCYNLNHLSNHTWNLEIQIHKSKSMEIEIPKDLFILWNSQPKWGQQGFISQSLGSQTQLTLTRFRFASILNGFESKIDAKTAPNSTLQVQQRTEPTDETATISTGISSNLRHNQVPKLTTNDSLWVDFTQLDNILCTGTVSKGWNCWVSSRWITQLLTWVCACVGGSYECVTFHWEKQFCSPRNGMEC